MKTIMKIKNRTFVLYSFYFQVLKISSRTRLIRVLMSIIEMKSTYLIFYNLSLNRKTDQLNSSRLLNDVLRCN